MILVTFSSKMCVLDNVFYQINFFIIIPVAPDWKSSCRGCGNTHAEGGELLLLSLLRLLLIYIIIVLRIGGTGCKASAVLRTAERSSHFDVILCVSNYSDAPPCPRDSRTLSPCQLPRGEI